MSGSRSGPTLLGIGAQKSATSWLHAVLGAHPEIGVSHPKEIDFFTARFDRGYRWYEHAFAQIAHLPVRAEVSPSYLPDLAAASRVRTYWPHMRIVVMLRNPVESAFSNHLHEVRKKHIPPLTFEDGLARNPAYLEQGRYGTHLARWAEVFPKEQILALVAERVTEDPAGAAQEIYRFAGVGAGVETAIAGERRNRSDRARSPMLRRVLRFGGDRMRGVGFEEPLARIKATRPVAALLKANSVDLRAEVAAMRPETRARLTAFFAPEMQRLCDLLGWSSSPWPEWRVSGGVRRVG